MTSFLGLVAQPCFNPASCDSTREVALTSRTKTPIVRQGLFSCRRKAIISAREL